ncbi:MAG: DUF411 domain-containing protein [Methylococcaceae bacterium]
MKRLKNFLAISLLLVNTGVSAENVEAEKPVEIVVYRSPTCGCCEKWLAHLQQNNFTIKDIVTTDVQSIKSKYGVPSEMASCHTAIVNGYVVEGHVPANDIKSLLKTKPNIVGIAVPGMPSGTPGMEMGGKNEPYKVIGFDKNSHTEIFNSYDGD